MENVPGELSPLQEITFAASDLLATTEWRPYPRNAAYECRQTKKNLSGNRILHVTQVRVAGQEDILTSHVQITSPDLRVIEEHGLNQHWKPVDEGRENVDTEAVKEVLEEALSEAS